MPNCWPSSRRDARNLRASCTATSNGGSYGHASNTSDGRCQRTRLAADHQRRSSSARRLSEPYLFNHAVRSWLFAAKIAHLKAIVCDLKVVAVGTILHEIGLKAGVSGSNRFEGNGADAG